MTQIEIFRASFSPSASLKSTSSVSGEFGRFPSLRGRCLSEPNQKTT